MSLTIYKWRNGLLGELIKRSAKSQRQRSEKFTGGVRALLEGLHSFAGGSPKLAK
jgi:hypothetical protein